MQLLVFAPDASIYHLTATPSGEVVQLHAGEPVEGVVSVNQSAYFSYYVPDDLSNATLIFTVTNGATGLSLSIGQPSYYGINGVWTVLQADDSNVLLFELDWSDPYLPSYLRQEGIFAAVLSSTADTATFSAVYSVTNGSSASIVQLLDGVPQYAVVQPQRYNFFYFTPPAEGWPYTVTVSVDYQSGYGTVRVRTSNGPAVGPLSTDWQGVVSGGDSLTIEPDMWGWDFCNPTTNATCGYSISVQGNTQTAYSITVTTSHYIRTLYESGWLTESAVLAVGDTDEWQTNVYVQTSAINPHLLVALTVLSGSVTVLASNGTSLPNATTAQWTWANVSSSVVLDSPIVAGVQEGQLLFTVTCTSDDGTACQYTLIASRYDESFRAIRGYSLLGIRPVSLVLPAGGIQWMLWATHEYSSLAYLFVEATVSSGTPTLYASCFLGRPNSNARLPNETNNSTWQAVAAPLAIELTNFNSSACPYLVLGVRASGGQSALVDCQHVWRLPVRCRSCRGGTETSAITMPAYPVSYYQYSQ